MSTDEYVSTGAETLDGLLSGGFRKGDLSIILGKETGMLPAWTFAQVNDDTKTTLVSTLRPRPTLESQLTSNNVEIITQEMLDVSSIQIDESVDRLLIETNDDVPVTDVIDLARTHDTAVALVTSNPTDDTLFTATKVIELYTNTTHEAMKHRIVLRKDTVDELPDKAVNLVINVEYTPLPDINNIKTM